MTSLHGRNFPYPSLNGRPVVASKKVISCVAMLCDGTGGFLFVSVRVMNRR